MGTKYYRFIYRNQGGGMCCSGSMAESGEAADAVFHFLYLGGGSGCCPMSEEMDASLKGHYHLIVVSDFKPQTVRQAVQVLGICTADRVLYPEVDADALEGLAQAYEQTGNFTKDEVGFVRNPKKYLAGKGISQGDGINERETFQKGNRIFRVFCVGKGSGRTLLLYHGSIGTSPQKEECVMNVKPVTPSRNCSPFVDPKNLNCEMRCMLYNDFTQCKRHNQRNGTYFVDGHLILGSESAAADLGDIRRALEEEWKRIRFVCLPQEDSLNDWKEQLLTVGTEEMAQYFMGTEALRGTVIKDILKDPYRMFVALSEKTGLCVSGYYIGR